MAPDLRDQVVDFVRTWTEKAELPAERLVGWMEVSTSKFYDWKQRYGKVNEHNSTVTEFPQGGAATCR